MLRDALDSLAREDLILANNIIILDDLITNMAHRLMRDLRETPCPEDSFETEIPEPIYPI